MSQETNIPENDCAQAQNKRREFLAIIGRNALGIAVVGTTATLAKIGGANAQVPLGNCGPDRGGEGCPIPCFLKGTKILTTSGERNVEDLVVGDLLPTEFGGARPIQWIGSYRRLRSDRSKPWVESAQPVRISRGAIAPNVPHDDLYVTGGHAIFLDGALVPAELLVNGTTITRCAADHFDELHYFHIKMETHDVIYAEGTPCETLAEVDEKSDNFPDYLRRYGASKTEFVPCAPYLGYNGALAEIKDRLRVIASLGAAPCRIDAIRDRLAERATMLEKELEQVS